MSDSLGFLIGDVSRLLRRNFDERARSIGVTRAQWRVLTSLVRHEGATQVALADLLEVEPITLSRMVDRLQEAGLVERRPDPADRRAWRLYLTEKAAVPLAQLKACADVMLEETLEGLDDADQQKLRILLERMRQNLSRKNNESDGARVYG